MTKLTEQEFQKALSIWQNSRGGKSFWGKLALQFNNDRGEFAFLSGEDLRTKFRAERKRQGIRKFENKIIQDKSNLPVIGVIDIEMLPAEAFFFQADSYITSDKVIRDGCLLSFAGKYLFNDTMFSDVLTPVEAVTREDRRITQSLNDFVQTCDYLIGHNIKGYDYPHLKTLSMLYHLKPVKHKLLDTLAWARSDFKFTYKSMAFINKKLGIRNKISNEGFALWRNCSDGDAEALQIMLDYNEGDIFASEELFWRFQPYVSGIPNFSLYDVNPVQTCICGSQTFKQEGYWTTETAKFDKLRCEGCGSLVRGKKNLLSKEKRNSLLVSL